MELPERISKLRKEHGLTQEQLAQQLYVSRTAVSKWETGRGTPSLESLQMLAKAFDRTLDELLGAEDVIAIAKQENREQISRLVFRTNSICNIAAVISPMLPLYKVENQLAFVSVPLYCFNGWLAAVYWSFTLAMAACGVLQLAISRGGRQRARRILTIVGTLVNVGAVFLLILSSQPYPAVLFFALLLIKGAVMQMQPK